jgi:xanthine dehydrogenase accessory factor
MTRDVLAAILRARAEKRAVVLITRFERGEQSVWTPGDDTLDPGLREVARRAIATDDAFAIDTSHGRAFVQPYNPPPRLIVVGAVHIAAPLTAIATLAGYEVTIVDPREGFARRERFAQTVVRAWPDEALASMTIDHRTAVVTLTHDPKLDDPALEIALRGGAFYVGALGSGKTHASRLLRLEERGLAREALARIHGPIGMAIGARSPAEIAIAIAAQMTDVLRHGAHAKGAEP